MKKWVRLKEFAEQVGLSVYTLRKLIHENPDFPAIQHGPRLYYVDPIAAAEWIANQYVVPPCDKKCM